MTITQLTYPLLASAEVCILVSQRASQAQNAAALRLWLRVQVCLFLILEPASFLKPQYFAETYIFVTVISCAADLTVLYSIFCCLEDGFQAFGTIRAWAALAVISGLLFAVSAGIALPVKAHPIEIIALTQDQTFTYIRALCLIMLSLYGYLRASSWPRDLAWTWIGMAVYGITDAVVTRVQILHSNTNLLEIATTMAAALQLVGWYCALSYVPKPLTSLEIEGATNLMISNL